jgi:hypothetical protein
MSAGVITSLPLEVLEDHVAILAKTGAGKTYTGRGIAEYLMDAGRRVCVIDPTGAWYGLRLKPDGKTPSAYQVVIFGGDHADVPLQGVSGTRLAELIAEADWSCIIDTKRLTVAERTRLFTEFAERLASVNRRVLHLFIDEAHLFAPQQRVNDPRSSVMLHAANNLVSGGRVLGLRIVMLSQRPAKLHKDSLTQAETLVAMRVIHNLDRGAVEAWIKHVADSAQGKEILSSLAGMPTGEGWVWSPVIGLLSRVKFRRNRTFDSSKAPGVDDVVVQPRQLTKLDLGELRDALKVATPTIVNAGNASLQATIVALQAEIVTLKRERQEKSGAAPDPALQLKAFNEGASRGLKAGFEAGYSSGWGAAVMQAKQALDPLFQAKARDPSEEGVRTAVSLLEVKWLASAKMLAAPPASVTKAHQSAPKVTKAHQSAPKPGPQKVAQDLGALSGSPPPPPPAADDGEPTPIPGAQLHLLRALAWWSAMGHAKVTRSQLAAIAGWKINSSHLRNRLTELLNRGLVSYPDRGHVALTPAGALAAPPPDLGQTLIASIRQILSGAQRTLFDALLERAGDAVSRELLAGFVGWEVSSSHLRNRLTELKNLDLVDYPGRGLVGLTDWVVEGMA